MEVLNWPSPGSDRAYLEQEAADFLREGLRDDVEAAQDLVRVFEAGAHVLATAPPGRCHGEQGRKGVHDSLPNHQGKGLHLAMIELQNPSFQVCSHHKAISPLWWWKIYEFFDMEKRMSGYQVKLSEHRCDSARNDKVLA